jgi:hypothetical protein
MNTQTVSVRTAPRSPWQNSRGRTGRQFGEILKQVRIPTELAGKLATMLRESQSDKEKFVRTSMLRLQQQQMLLRCIELHIRSRKSLSGLGSAVRRVC